VAGPGRTPVEILATDVNNRVLDEARAGLYGEFSLRNTPPYYRSKYFRKEGHLFRLHPEVRAMVTFRKLNLLRAEALLPASSFHAVLCRNVLIYFDVEAKRQTVRSLVRLLRLGGLLIVGRSESLFNIPEAPALVNLGGVLVHRKP
jgi:chemotaxis protein methyltransferase CheR